jgi:hypothetical protein
MSEREREKASKIEQEQDRKDNKAEQFFLSLSVSLFK